MAPETISCHQLFNFPYFTVSTNRVGWCRESKPGCILQAVLHSLILSSLKQWFTEHFYRTFTEGVSQGQSWVFICLYIIYSF